MDGAGFFCPVREEPPLDAARQRGDLFVVLLVFFI
jgi:hypothetical protein